jgi:hypothetical protein
MPKPLGVITVRPIGYMYKRVEKRPDWLKAPAVDDICALSSCISKDFADYINYCKHNGFWLFDSPAVMQTLAAEHGIPLDGLDLFFYEAFEEEFDYDDDGWQSYESEPSFVTEVVLPASKTLLGFDVTSFSAHTSPECSPLSCNSRAEHLATNSHCLFRTFEEAKDAIESGAFQDSEPGPYRIIAVYVVNDA